jgi:hypothetical protein
MATITITIPDKSIDRVTDGFCYKYSYSPLVYDANGKSIPNPETKSQFMRRKVVEYIKSGAVEITSLPAAETARKSAADKANSEIGIT